MKLRLTDLAVQKLSLPDKGQVDVFDQQTPNFGIRCSSKSKSFFVLLGGSTRRRRRTIGRYPDLSLANARKLARQMLATEAISPSIISPTFSSVKDAYLADCERRLRPSTFDGYFQYLNNITFAVPIAEVTQGQIIRAIEKYTSSPSSQNYAFTTFKVFFNWAVKRQFLAANPLAALTRPNRQSPRERALSEAELGTLLRYCNENRRRFTDIVTLLALTGQRRGEIAGLQWSEIDQDQLLLPPERTKNQREHVLPLGPRTLKVLHNIDGGSTHVFGTQHSDGPFNGWSKAQKFLLKETGLDHFTLHDLRRTYSTIHAKIGTPIHVTERLLNHSSGTISGVAAIYNRHNYLEEMTTAVAAFESHISDLFDS